MYQIQLKYRGSTKKITVPKSLNSNELSKLIVQCFTLNQKVIGVTDKAGRFHQLSKMNAELAASRQIFSLVTAKDLTQDNMSFASEYYHRKSKDDFAEDQDATEPTLDIPERYSTKCVGIISDLEMFEELMLGEGGITVVACFTKVKPHSQTPYEYFLYQNQTKNSVMVYSGTVKVCEFYVSDWTDPNPEVAVFIQGLTGTGYEMPTLQNMSPNKKSDGFSKKSKTGDGELMAKKVSQRDEEEDRDQQIKQSFMDNLNRLLDEGELSQLEYYKLKAQVLENPQQFLKKYQMGTHQGLRNDSRQVNSKQERRQYVQSKQEKRDRGRSANRFKRYQIPIIVRKYNNVVQKISTSYPLSRQQEQSINLILQLELKGLITQKEAGHYKSQILQQQEQTFKLFKQYFQDNIDQIELASKLRRRRTETSGFRQESREKSEHQMRLLIKYAKQSSYELLRKLALEDNKHVLGAISGYRNNKNVEQLQQKLDKIASYYKAKEDLEDVESL